MKLAISSVLFLVAGGQLALGSQVTKAETSAVATKTMAKSSTTSAKSASSIKTTATSTSTAATATVSLNANILDCDLVVPADPLSATGLSTPYILKAPCSMAVGTQQGFAEAAIYDPSTGEVSIYHPLIINEGTQPAAKPVVPTVPQGATVGIWYGFNGMVLTLVDSAGKVVTQSSTLDGANCVQGNAGVLNDVFGQVSWCNAQQFFAAVNSGGKVKTTALGTSSSGTTCPSTRSFEIVDACPSDNVVTQYLLLPNGQTAQFSAANQKALPDATVINNASDEALVASIIDPLIGCTPFLGASIDNPGTQVAALALSELQAAAQQAAPVAFVPLNDPDTLTTVGTQVSTSKTNTYRLGVNQPLLGTGNATATNGELVPYCDNMIAVAPPFLLQNQAVFTKTTTPDADVGNNLFTFMCNRYLMSLTQLTCAKPAFQPITCVLDGNGAATSCTITLQNTATTTSAKATSTSKSTSTSKVTSATSAKSTAVVTSKASTSTAKASSTAAKTATKGGRAVPSNRAPGQPFEHRMHKLRRSSVH